MSALVPDAASRVVPFPFLIRQLVSLEYEVFQRVAVALEHDRPDFRSRRLLLHLLSAKARFSQLLALARWAAVHGGSTASDTARLQRQSLQEKLGGCGAFVDGLYYLHARLFSRRSRKWDVEAAVEALSGRGYPRLPSVLAAAGRDLAPALLLASPEEREQRERRRLVELQERLIPRKILHDGAPPRDFGTAVVEDGTLRLVAPAEIELWLVLDVSHRRGGREGEGTETHGKEDRWCEDLDVGKLPWLVVKARPLGLPADFVLSDRQHYFLRDGLSAALKSPATEKPEDEDEEAAGNDDICVLPGYVSSSLTRLLHRAQAFCARLKFAVLRREVLSLRSGVGASEKPENRMLLRVETSRADPATLAESKKANAELRQFRQDVQAKMMQGYFQNEGGASATEPQGKTSDSTAKPGPLKDGRDDDWIKARQQLVARASEERPWLTVHLWPSDLLSEDSASSDRLEGKEASLSRGIATPSGGDPDDVFALRVRVSVAPCSATDKARRNGVDAESSLGTGVLSTTQVAVASKLVIEAGPAEMLGNLQDHGDEHEGTNSRWLPEEDSRQLEAKLDKRFRVEVDNLTKGLGPKSERSEATFLPRPQPPVELTGKALFVRNATASLSPVGLRDCKIMPQLGGRAQEGLIDTPEARLTVGLAVKMTIRRAVFFKLHALKHALQWYQKESMLGEELASVGYNVRLERASTSADVQVSRVESHGRLSAADAFSFENADTPHLRVVFTGVAGLDDSVGEVPEIAISVNVRTGKYVVQNRDLDRTNADGLSTAEQPRMRHRLHSATRGWEDHLNTAWRGLWQAHCKKYRVMYGEKLALGAHTDLAVDPRIDMDPSTWIEDDASAARLIGADLQSEGLRDPFKHLCSLGALAYFSKSLIAQLSRLRIRGTTAWRDASEAQDEIRRQTELVDLRRALLVANNGSDSVDSASAVASGGDVFLPYSILLCLGSSVEPGHSLAAVAVGSAALRGATRSNPLKFIQEDIKIACSEVRRLWRDCHRRLAIEDERATNKVTKDLKWNPAVSYELHHYLEVGFGGDGKRISESEEQINGLERGIASGLRLRTRVVTVVGVHESQGLSQKEASVSPAQREQEDRTTPKRPAPSESTDAKEEGADDMTWVPHFKREKLTPTDLKRKRRKHRRVQQDAAHDAPLSPVPNLTPTGQREIGWLAAPGADTSNSARLVAFCCSDVQTRGFSLSKEPPADEASEEDVVADGRLLFPGGGTVRDLYLELLHGSLQTAVHLLQKVVAAGRPSQNPPIEIRLRPANHLSAWIRVDFGIPPLNVTGQSLWFGVVHTDGSFREPNWKAAVSLSSLAANADGIASGETIAQGVLPGAELSWSVGIETLSLPNDEGAVCLVWTMAAYPQRKNAPIENMSHVPMWMLLIAPLSYLCGFAPDASGLLGLGQTHSGVPNGNYVIPAALHPFLSTTLFLRAAGRFGSAEGGEGGEGKAVATATESPGGNLEEASIARKELQTLVEELGMLVPNPNRPSRSSTSSSRIPLPQSWCLLAAAALKAASEAEPDLAIESRSASPVPVDSSERNDEHRDGDVNGNGRVSASRSVIQNTFEGVAFLSDMLREILDTASRNGLSIMDCGRLGIAFPVLQPGSDPDQHQLPKYLRERALQLSPNAPALHSRTPFLVHEIQTLTLALGDRGSLAFFPEAMDRWRLLICMPKQDPGDQTAHLSHLSSHPRMCLQAELSRGQGDARNNLSLQFFRAPPGMRQSGFLKGLQRTAGEEATASEATSGGQQRPQETAKEEEVRTHEQAAEYMAQRIRESAQNTAH